MSKSLITQDIKVRVSSVLNRDTKQFGRKFLFDGNDETCWNSDEGSPQWVKVEFPETVFLTSIHMQFQGGFVGKTCTLEGQSSDEEEFDLITECYPDDSNALQIFPVKDCEAIKRLKITFKESTDFFGRVTVYKLDILGYISS
ncbi:nuclear receptor 2C2-associated protein-like [Anneissia japonica]|uniref:nuclear receptor 2C2-associated protein-like n=1 Tax=Anneissia japonica TaxID=1529436 RepID=UPI001425B3B4|nr:nuclear receptor 2C2-associated protein-like [Anneissia japonica]